MNEILSFYVKCIVQHKKLVTYTNSKDLTIPTKKSKSITSNSFVYLTLCCFGDCSHPSPDYFPVAAVYIQTGCTENIL